MSDTSPPASSVEPFATPPTRAVDPSQLHIPSDARTPLDPHPSFDQPIGVPAVSAGAIVTRTAEVFGAVAGKVLVVTGLVYLVNLAIGLYLVLSPIIVQPEDLVAANLLIFFTRMFLTFILAGVAAAPITYTVVQHLRGQRPTLGEAVRQGLRRIFPSVATSLFVTLLGGLAMCCFFVPGFIVFSMLYVAIPVVVIERTGVIEALSRSRELTRGYKASIFGFFILLIAGLWLIGFIMKTVHITDEVSTSGVVGAWVVSVLFGAISAIATSVTYHDLRVSKEGVQTDELARVFD
jgi:hypothetical protein